MSQRGHGGLAEEPQDPGAANHPAAAPGGPGVAAAEENVTGAAPGGAPSEGARPGATPGTTSFCDTWDAETWPSFPRGRLVLLSSLYPSKVDAKFSRAGGLEHPELERDYEAHGVMDRSPEPLPMAEMVKHRYQIHLDGNSQSCSLYWKLLADAVVFLPESAVESWVSPGPSSKGDALVAFEHFVPVREDLADLVELLHRYDQDPAAARQIARKGRAFALRMTSQEASLEYVARVLFFYHKLATR